MGRITAGKMKKTTGGSMITAGKFTAGALTDLLQKCNIHPTVAKKLHETGFINKFVDIVNKSDLYNKHKDADTLAQKSSVIKNAYSRRQNINNDSVMLDQGGKMDRRSVVSNLMRKKENGGRGMTMAEAQLYYNNMIKKHK